MKAGLLGSIFAGVAAAGVFVVLVLVLAMAWWWALLIAVAALVGATLLFSGVPSRREPIITYPFGVTEESINKAILDGQAKIREIQGCTAAIPKPDVRLKVGQLCATINHILEDFRQDPKDLPASRQFLNYYLDATGKIVRRYAELSQHSTRSPQVQESLARAEASLDLIDQAFTRHLGRLLEDDVMDLDTEIALLEKTVKMETILDEK